MPDDFRHENHSTRAVTLHTANPATHGCSSLDDTPLIPTRTSSELTSATGEQHTHNSICDVQLKISKVLMTM